MKKTKNENPLATAGARRAKKLTPARQAVLDKRAAANEKRALAEQVKHAKKAAAAAAKPAGLAKARSGRPPEGSKYPRLYKLGVGASCVIAAEDGATIEQTRNRLRSCISAIMKREAKNGNAVAYVTEKTRHFGKDAIKIQRNA